MGGRLNKGIAVTEVEDKSPEAQGRVDVPSREQRRYLDRRAAMIRWWPLAGWSMLLITVATWSYLFYRVPLLVNPYAVVHAMNEGTLGGGTLAMLAVLAPVAVLGCGVLLVCGLLLMFAAMGNERRLLAIVEALLRTDTADAEHR